MDVARRITRHPGDGGARGAPLVIADVSGASIVHADPERALLALSALPWSFVSESVHPIVAGTTTALVYRVGNVIDVMMLTLTGPASVPIVYVDGMRSGELLDLGGRHWALVGPLPTVHATRLDVVVSASEPCEMVVTILDHVGAGYPLAR